MMPHDVEDQRTGLREQRLKLDVYKATLGNLSRLEADRLIAYFIG